MLVTVLRVQLDASDPRTLDPPGPLADWLAPLTLAEVELRLLLLVPLACSLMVLLL